MTVRINKDAINLREKLSQLDKPSGLVGEELLRADTSADAREALNLEEHLFEDFESTGIDDNATSTKVTVSNSGVDVDGTVTADGLVVSGSSTGTLNVANFLNTNSSANATANRLGLGISNSAGANYTYIEAKEVGADNFAEMNFYTGVAPTKRMTVGTNGDVSFYEDTGTTAKFFWDASAESLGIGTASPSEKLHIDGTDTTVLITEGSEGSARLMFADSQANPDQSFELSYDTGGTNELLFRRNDSTVGRWMSDGFIAGQSNATSPYAILSANNDATKAGTALRDTGYLAAARYQAEAMNLNRMGDDGEIAVFRKDGTTVGSIGSYLGDLTVGTEDTGLLYHNVDNAIKPWHVTANVARNGVTNLGDADHRFKDLYLSGGVYLGGTGSANKLDDYEEGNWTPTALNYDGTLTVDSATYVKVGALVTIKAKVSFDATADASGVNLSNLPFVTTGVDKANGGFIVSSTVSSAARVQALGTGSFYLMTTDDSNIPYTTMASTSLEFVAIYETNQ